MSYGTHLSESRHTSEWVMAHIWVSHGTHVSESWHTSEWIMAHIWVNHGTHLSESWHTSEWVMSFRCLLRGSTARHRHWRASSGVWSLRQVWVSHGTQMSEAGHTYLGVMARMWSPWRIYTVRDSYTWFMWLVTASHTKFVLERLIYIAFASFFGFWLKKVTNYICELKTDIHSSWLFWLCLSDSYT